MSGLQVGKITVTFWQDEDSDGRAGSDIQELRVESCDAGGGPYLAIHSERWAFDDPAEFAALLTRVLDLHATLTPEAGHER